MQGFPGMPGMGGDMSQMMNNPMVQQMMQNPEMIKMAQQMMANMGGKSGAPVDPQKMQEVMQNPSLQKLLDNPEFLDSTIQMLKNPMARGQVDQMAKSMNMNPDTLIRVLEFLVSCAYGYKRVRGVVFNPIIMVSLAVLVISYLLKWFGFTAELLFMMPFK